MVECSDCGFQNPAGSRFCSQCGARLPEELHTGDTTHVIALVEDEPRHPDMNSDLAAALKAVPAGAALLVCTRGGIAEERYLLDAEVTTVGRATECDIFLDDITVSRHHAKFLLHDGEVTVEDGGSLNGTYVNRTLVDGSALLHAGDEVQIGKFKMMLYVGEPGRS
ncbi:MAG: FHA domain-containing protein [Propionibacteriaceae bacterium]|nr:FHA domain-containing protein [Propionibacteriaceae bacterium]